MMERVLLRIDDPADRVLRTPVCRIRGWCAAADWSEVERFEFQIGDAQLSWQTQARQDVTAEHTELWVAGFSFNLDLRQYLYAIRSSELAIRAVFPGSAAIDLEFRVAPGVTASCLAAAGI